MRLFAVSAVAAFVLVLAACAAPNTAEQPSPEATASPTAPAPQPTPQPQPAMETPQGVLDPQAEQASSAAANAVAAQLAVDAVEVRVVSAVPMEWPDSCLGLPRGDEMCAQAITPGYLVVVEANGQKFEARTNQDGTVVRLVGGAQGVEGGVAAQWAMEWRANGEPCQIASIGADGAAVGGCGDDALRTSFLTDDRQSDLAYYTRIYASFDADTPAGHLRFTGAGPASASAAEQRMLAEWARLVAQETETGRSGASWGQVLAWHREGGFAGFCDDLGVYASGNAIATSCRTNPPQDRGKRWLSAGQAQQLFDWADGLRSFEAGQKDAAKADAMTIRMVFTGTGAIPAGETDQQAMSTFASDLLVAGAVATSTQSIEILADVPVYDRPTADSQQIGQIAAGQTALVSGVSPDGQWWRVICADGTVGECWVTTDPAQTQPQVVSPDQPVSSSDPTPTPLPAPVAPDNLVDAGPASVASIDVLMLESFPVQVNVVAQGNLPDGCTSIGDITTERQDNQFAVTMGTVRQTGVPCTEALVAFEQTIPLDVAGLPAGVYTVAVNGVQGQFELAVDN